MPPESIISRFGYQAPAAGLPLEGGAVLNLISGLLWALMFKTTVYIFGQIVEVILVDGERYESRIALDRVQAGTSAGWYRRQSDKVPAKAGSNE